MLLQARSLTLVPYQGRMDSRAPLGVAIPTPNYPPAWSAAPALLDFTGGITTLFDWSVYAADPNDDVLTYSLIGAPAGITIASSTGVMTVANTVGNNVYTFTVRISDGSLNTDHSVACTVAAAAATHTIATNVSNYNASSVQPGELIYLAAGNRGPLVIQNAQGSVGNEIRVVSDPGGAHTTTIRRTSAATGGFIATIQACHDLIIDGGYNVGTTYGIKVTVAASGDGPSHFIKFNGICNRIKIRYVEIDGKWPSLAVNGIGIGTSDTGIKKADYPGVYSEGHTVEYCYLHDIEGEGIYSGPNYVALTIPHRNMTVAYNLVEDCGWDAIQVKCWWSGTNSIHHNICRRGGKLNDGASGQHYGISISSSEADVYSNIVEDSGEAGISFYVLNGPSETVAETGYGTFATFDCDVYNNVVVRSGLYGPQKGHGITGGSGPASTLTKPRLHVFCNTLLNNGISGNLGDGINFASQAGACWARNNIVFGNGGSQISLNSSSTKADNLESGNTTTLFVNYLGGNYHLAAANLATGTVGTEIPSVDIEGTTRTTGTADRGAYEYV